MISFRNWIACATVLIAIPCSGFAQSSAELLFVNSDSAGALTRSAEELARNPADVNARFVHMEAARVQLRSEDEIASAIAVLRRTNAGDARGALAARRIQELAANTRFFRAVCPELLQLIRARNPWARQLSTAILAAEEDGLFVASKMVLTRRITCWQIAGPFGRLSNVDFDAQWAPEHDQLRRARYGKRVRETVVENSGLLTFPNYFTGPGVYYAASDLHISPGKYRFTVEGEGTFVLFLDGRKVLVHDARFQQQSSESHFDIDVVTENHRVLLKLQASATPIRVWLEAAVTLASNSSYALQEERRYVAAANPSGAHDSLRDLVGDASSIEQTLKADEYLRRHDEDRAREALEDALKSDRNNLLAEWKLASVAFGREQFEEAVTHLAKVLDGHPDFWPAQELKYELADHFGWQLEKEQAMTQRVRLHPTCAALSDAIRLYSESERAERAGQYARGLETCSPVPYRYWQQLSRMGRHEEALASLQRYLSKQPQNRQALLVAIREAVLAGKNDVARRESRMLHTVAPNWELAKRLAARPKAVLDSSSAHEAADDFFTAYVRDPWPLLTAPITGAPNARVLLNDGVVKLGPDGGAWVYRHWVTQVLDKGGLATVGEVALPNGVDLLQLRTLKKSGVAIEADLDGGWDKISMPALEVGDAVEAAYVEHFSPEMVTSSPQLLDFLFASEIGPTISARLVVIHGLQTPELWHSRQVVQTGVQREQDLVVRTFEAADLRSSADEANSPKWERRARVLFLDIDGASANGSRAALRDKLIESTKITHRVSEFAGAIRRPGAEDQIAAVYREVTSSIDEDDESWSGTITSADETLASGEGNRAAVLIAVLSAMGFDASLELASERDHRDPEDGCPESRCYTHPLVRVLQRGSKQAILLDPQMNGLVAGAISPSVEGEPAITISRTSASAPQDLCVSSSTDERSIAKADLHMDVNGAMTGTLQIRFGSLRGAQIREALRQLSSVERQDYLERIAARIFPSLRDVSASLTGEEQLQQPLVVSFKLETAPLNSWEGAQLGLGQLVPALGLGRMYAALPTRTQSLSIEAPLVEKSEFRVQLPNQIEAAELPHSVELSSPFGNYAADFKVSEGTLIIVRSFNIPAQIVSPAAYDAFSKFARDVDNSEREDIRIERRSAMAEAKDAVPPLKCSSTVRCSVSPVP